MTQRANGEGSIYKRSNGKWCGVAFVLAADGARKRRTVYGHTKAEVTGKLRDLISQTESGVPAAVSGWTVQSYAGYWLEHIAPSSLRPTTRTNYE
ncbi:MAG TPA: hypothetical protein VNJ04_11690 [Gemmatimonadaceae bacterium]|nr:hypothetical protein [Gemmatimonadaceae bacterium]